MAELDFNFVVGVASFVLYRFASSLPLLVVVFLPQFHFILRTAPCLLMSSRANPLLILQCPNLPLSVAMRWYHYVGGQGGRGKVRGLRRRRRAYIGGFLFLPFVEIIGVYCYLRCRGCFFCLRTWMCSSVHFLHHIMTKPESALLFCDAAVWSVSSLLSFLTPKV